MPLSLYKLFSDGLQYCLLRVSYEEARFKDLNHRPVSSKRSVLHQGVTQNDVECVKKLIEAGSEIDAKDERGNTPLQTAINLEYYWARKNSSNHLGCEIISMLVANGASIENLQFKHQQSAKYRILRKCAGGNFDFYQHTHTHFLKLNLPVISLNG